MLMESEVCKQSRRLSKQCEQTTQPYNIAQTGDQTFIGDSYCRSQVFRGRNNDDSKLHSLFSM